VSDSSQTITKSLVYNRAQMAERGRQGGRRKADRARPAVTLTGGDVEALADAYALLKRILERGAPREDGQGGDR
jgi:hypothetical protein